MDKNKTIAFDDDSSEDSEERVEMRPENPRKGVDPVEQAFVDRLSLLRTAEVESFLKVTRVPLRLVEPNPNSPWANMANMDFGSLFKVSSRSDWTDADMMNRPGVALELLDDDKVVEMGRDVLKVLTSQQHSQQSIAGILVLAWNLRCPTTLLPMFPEDDPTATGNDVPISQFSDSSGDSFMCRSGKFTELTDDVAVNAAGYTYLAASLLRLATKPEENYLADFPKIKGSFQNFFKIPFPLQNLVLNKNMIGSVKLLLAQDSPFRNSLTGFLYVHESIENGKGLRRYLYEQHLGCTGMHAYDLALRILKEKRFTIRTLCSSICHRSFKEALKELYTIFMKHDSHQAADASPLQTWRYARVFDHQYFSELQTKNCTSLVYILATILYAMTNAQDSNAGNIFKIKQLERVSYINKYWNTSVAFKAYLDPNNTSGQNYWELS